MHCSACFTDVGEWIRKYSVRAKVYLDKLYFDENKVPYKEDEHGYYITGIRFAEIEEAKAKERCPRCGTKMEDICEVQWGPI